MSIHPLRYDTTANPTISDTSGVPILSDGVPADTGSGFVEWGGEAVQFGTVASLRGQLNVGQGVYNVMDPTYGAVDDGVTDCTTAIQKAITAAPAGSTLRFPTVHGLGYLVSSTLQVNTRNLAFVFDGGTIAQNGINYTGTGPCIQLDTDDGNPWTNGSYNGRGSGFTLINCLLNYTGTTDSALVNGFGNYKSGSYGVRDWRGGSIQLINCKIAHFQYGFWGIQSDVNHFRGNVFEFNKIARYLGPRSDQLVSIGEWTAQNDTSLQVEGAAGGRVIGWQSDTDGSTSTFPCVIKNFNDGAGNIRAAGKWHFDTPWCENFGSTNTTEEVEAFFSLGSADTQVNDTVTIRDAYVITQYYTTPGHFLFLVRADQVKHVIVDSPSATSNTFTNNLRCVVKVINDGASTSVPLVDYIDGEDPAAATRVIENYSATAVTVVVRGPSTATYRTNNIGGTGAVTLVTLGDKPVITKLTATDHISVGATEPPGTDALYRGDSSLSAGSHIFDVQHGSTGARFITQASANEVVIGSSNAFPVYLESGGEWKWKLINTAGTSYLLSVQTSTRVVPGSNGLQVRNSADSQDNLKVDDSGNATLHGSLALGTTGTPLTLAMVYTPTLTPSSVAANTTATQTFAVSGLTTADKVFVCPPSMTAGTGIVGHWVSGANTLSITFSNNTAGALTPASGTYQILAIRS